MKRAGGNVITKRSVVHTRPLSRLAFMVDIIISLRWLCRYTRRIMFVVVSGTRYRGSKSRPATLLVSWKVINHNGCHFTGRWLRAGPGVDVARPFSFFFLLPHVSLDPFAGFVTRWVNFYETLCSRASVFPPTLSLQGCKVTALIVDAESILIDSTGT